MKNRESLWRCEGFATQGKVFLTYRFLFVKPFMPTVSARHWVQQHWLYLLILANFQRTGFVSTVSIICTGEYGNEGFSAF